MRYNVLDAVLLYADDAAIPADTAKDLQLSADIFAKYCNDHHLFISVPKTLVTVFHVENDENVAYTDDGKVIVDGHSVVVQDMDSKCSLRRRLSI